MNVKLVSPLRACMCVCVCERERECVHQLECVCVYWCVFFEHVCVYILVHLCTNTKSMCLKFYIIFIIILLYCIKYLLCLLCC